MTEAFRDSALSSSPWPAAAGFAAMISTFGDALQTCVSAGTAWQSEIAKFADRRIAENRRTCIALLSSRDLGSLLKVQQHWALQAMRDYTEEATRTARLAASLGLTGTTPQVQCAATLLS